MSLAIIISLLIKKVKFTVLQVNMQSKTVELCRLIALYTWEGNFKKISNKRKVIRKQVKYLNQVVANRVH